MIARFIYTDCESNGPFTPGVGKKFKSVVFPAAASAGAPSIESLKDRMPRNSLSDGYVLPNVPNSMTMAEFEALPKSWAFAQIGEDTFAFERIATAGQCYGRNNRFDEGFIFSPDAWETLTAMSGGVTKPTQLRPVDYVHSSGWLHPRGEIELEAAELSAGFYELEPNFREQLKADLALVRRLPNLGELTKSFASTQAVGSALFVPKAQAKEFFAIVSILTRLTAPVYAWQTGFSDVWEQPRAATLADAKNPHFLLSDQPNALAGAKATMWGKVAEEVFAAGIPGKLMAKIDDLATNVFAFNPAKRIQGLCLLPFAVALQSQEDMAGKEHLVQLATDLLATDKFPRPAGWRPGAEVQLKQAAQNAAFRSTNNSVKIEELLRAIGGAA